MTKRTDEQRIADLEARLASAKAKKRQKESRGLILLGIAAAKIAAKSSQWMLRLKEEIEADPREDNREAARLALAARAKVPNAAPITPPQGE